jgi:putative ABC transport system permease protein
MRRRGVKRLFRFPWRTAADIRDDVADEFAFHVDMRTEALVASGLSVQEARAQAVREFGDFQRAATVAVTHQERIERRHRLARWVDDLQQDLRHAWRSLRRTPVFTATAVLVLALGLGATTALFSVLFTVLLRPLPYPDADRLVEVWDTRRDSGTARDATALPDYRALRDGNRTFDAMGAFGGSAFIITGGDRAEYIQASSVTAAMWRVLGSQPILGRTFSEAEEAWGQHRVAVISEGFWRRRFGADRGVLGTRVRVGPQELTIIGVMPASFQIIGVEAEMWVPFSFPPGSVMDSRRNRFASVLGRLKPGVSLQQARDDLTVIAARLASEDPQFNAGRGVDIGWWQEGVVGGVRSTLLLLFGAVVLVLSIACANLANLLIARATTRDHELHTRAVLGAGSGRLIRQALTETFVLVTVGGAAGFALAVTLLRGLALLGPIGLPRMNEIAVDGTVVAFAAGLILLTTLFFGLWPCRHAARAGHVGRIRAAARTITGGRMEQRSRRALIVAEVSLSLVLLIGASLLIVSLQRLQQVSAGFNAERLFTAMVLRFRPNGREDFVQQLVDKLASSPGIRAAAATTSLPLMPGGWSKYYSVEGQPAPESLAGVSSVSYHHVTPSYFATMQADLQRGRAFTAQDRADQPLVAIVNETFARRVWGENDPIGKRIFMAAPEPLSNHLLPLPDGSTTFPRLTIVGVVGDFRHDGLDQAARPSVFVPLAQAARAGGGDQIQGFHYLVVRTVADPLSVGTAVEAAARALDRNAAVSDVRRMESRLSDSIARRRFAMLLLGAFAVLAFLLAVVGLYGVMSYAVSQRREELGLRAAVGASTASLVRLVMMDGIQMTLVGAGIGLSLAVGLSGLMAAQLYEVQGIDLRVYAGVTALFLFVAATACWIPAIRAARVDPAVALRADG